MHAFSTSIRTSTPATVLCINVCKPTKSSQIVCYLSCRPTSPSSFHRTAHITTRSISTLFKTHQTTHSILLVSSLIILRVTIPSLPQFKVQLAHVLSPVVMAHVNSFITNDVIHQNQHEYCSLLDKQSRYISSKFISLHRQKENALHYQRGVNEASCMCALCECVVRSH